MNVLLGTHILGGALGLIAGFIALYTAKGASAHRAAGRVFVVSMLTMTFTALVVESVRRASPATNATGALLTAYLVTTGFTTLRPPAKGARWISRVGTALALGVGLICLVFGFEAIAAGGERDGMPAFPFFLFGVVGVVGGVGDVRAARAGGVAGRGRLARHLWRMCFALFIATLSFFLGQTDQIPEVLRIPVLLAAPVLAVPLTMFFWLWRVRRRRSHRTTHQTTAEAT